MNLNLSIIQDDLKEFSFQGQVTSDRLTRKLSFPVLYNGEASLLADRLYLTEASQLPEKIDLSHSPSFLCIGTPPIFYLEGNCNMLYTKKELSLPQLLNKVAEIFHYYQSWEKSIQNANIQNQSLKALCTLAEPIFQNPIYMFDSTMKCLFSVINRDRYILPVGYDTIKDDAYIRMENINVSKNNAHLSSSNTIQEPAIYPDSVNGYRSLYLNIFYYSKYSVRIVIDEVNKKFTDRDFALLMVFGVAIRDSLLRKETLNLGHPKYMDGILTRLLGHQFIDESKIHFVLSEIGYNVFDTYFCITAEPTTYDHTSETLNTLASHLSTIVLCECHLIYKESVVLVYNLTALESTREEVLKKLEPHLSDHSIKIGISTLYNDFKELYHYYQQTLIALEIGKKKHPQLAEYLFINYELDYIVEKSTDSLSPEALCPEGLARLLEHDRLKGSNYANILRVYLENSLNIAASIRHLDLHRNTFLYRLNRIEEILQMDLENNDIRLLLMLIFKVLDV